MDESISNAIDGSGAPPLPVNEDGTIRVPSFALPISAGLSAEARAAQILHLGNSIIEVPDFSRMTTEAEFAAYVDEFRLNLDDNVAQPLAQAMEASFPVSIEEQEIGSVRTERFLAGDCTEDSGRVLLNLHGGAFISGARYIARAESIPIAFLSQIPVLSIDYRMGYEYRFPAALEDVAFVYLKLLEKYPPSHIGIYGGSAGGRLTAQVVAYFIQHEIPVPGAIGIFGSGGGGPGGDSTYLSAIATAKAPPPPGDDPIESVLFGRFGYMAVIGRGDPIAEPLTAGDDLLAKYPPTLFVTATRAFDLSPAIAFHRALTRVGVDASLHVFEGLGHCFYYNAWLPESRDAYQTIVSFFRKRLGLV